MGRTALRTSTDDDYNDYNDYHHYDNNCAHDDDFEFDINVVNKFDHVILEYIIYKYVDFHFNNHHDAITARLG